MRAAIGNCATPAPGSALKTPFGMHGRKWGTGANLGACRGGGYTYAPGPRRIAPWPRGHLASHDARVRGCKKGEGHGMAVEAGTTNPPVDGREGSPGIQSVPPGTYASATGAGRSRGVGRGYGAPVADDT